MTATAHPVGLADIQAARALLEGVVSTTPIAGARALSELCAGPVWLKCENLQRTGSFKIRGAYTRISRLDDGERARGVVAASAGNHAQGVALAAQMLGIHATVFMPVGAALPKVAATRGYGAEVHLEGATIEGSLAAAHRLAAETGAVLVHPFDHVDVIAGQGTVGLEILEQVPDVAHGAGVHRRRRTAGWHRGRGEGVAARRRGGRGAGRRSRGLAGVAGRGRAR